MATSISTLRPSINRVKVLDQLRRSGVEVPDDVAVDVFGNTPKMAAELGELVRTGQKCATSSLLWAWEYEGKEPPRAGVVEVVVDWHGQVLAVIQTTDVQVMAFGDIGEEFARAEGEGDLTLDHWRRVHWDFFAEECEQVGRRPSQGMPVVCQRFRVLHRTS